MRRLSPAPYVIKRRRIGDRFYWIPVRALRSIGGGFIDPLSHCSAGSFAPSGLAPLVALFRPTVAIAPMKPDSKGRARFAWPDGGFWFSVALRDEGRRVRGMIAKWGRPRGGDHRGAAGWPGGDESRPGVRSFVELDPELGRGWIWDQWGRAVFRVRIR